MTVAPKLMTADELLRLPKGRFRYELVRGELRKMAPTGFEHGTLTMRLGAALDQHVKANNLGLVVAAETGFKLSDSPDTVRAPDVAFVSQQRLDEAGDVEGYFPGAPDLVVEVISPSDRYTEVEEQVFEWLEHGSSLVIVVNPRKRSATVYRSLSDIKVLTQKDSLDGGDVVPGWSLQLADVFAY